MKLLLLLTFTTLVLADPHNSQGFYQQQYQYQQSSAAYQNNELQRENQDRGYYYKEGDLEGRYRPIVDARTQHTEYVNPKSRGAYYDGIGGRQATYGQLNAQATDQFYNQNVGVRSGAAGIGAVQGNGVGAGGGEGFIEENYGIRSKLRQIAQALQDDLSRELQMAIYNQHRRAQAYGTTNYAQVQNDLRLLETDLRRNITMRLQEALRSHYGTQGIRGSFSYSIRDGRLQPTANYNYRELEDIKREIELNLMRQLEEGIRNQFQFSYTASRAMEEGTAGYRRVTESVYRPEPVPVPQQPPIPRPVPVPQQPIPRPVPVPQQPIPIPQPVQVIPHPMPDSIATIATRVQNNINERLNWIIEDVERRHLQTNMRIDRYFIDNLLAQIQQDLQRNITMQLETEFRRNMGYNFKTEDLETYRRQIESNLMTKLNRDFYKLIEKHFESQNQSFYRNTIYETQPINYHNNYMSENTDMMLIRRQLEEQLLRQLQYALMEHQQRARFNDNNYEATLQFLTEELNRNLTRQFEQTMAQYRGYGAANDAQFATLRNELQDLLQRQLQRGLQEHYSSFSTWSGHQSRASHYRAVREFPYPPPNPIIDDCLGLPEPMARFRRSPYNSYNRSPARPQEEEVGQEIDDSDLTQQIQEPAFDNLDQQGQAIDDSDLVQQVQEPHLGNLNQQGQEIDDSDLTQQVEDLDLTQNVEDSNEQTPIPSSKPSSFGWSNQRQDHRLLASSSQSNSGYGSHNFEFSTPSSSYHYTRWNAQRAQQQGSHSSRQESIHQTRLVPASSYPDLSQSSSSYDGGRYRGLLYETTPKPSSEDLTQQVQKTEDITNPFREQSFENPNTEFNEQSNSYNGGHRSFLYRPTSPKPVADDSALNQESNSYGGRYRGTLLYKPSSPKQSSDDSQQVQKVVPLESPSLTQSIIDLSEPVSSTPSLNSILSSHRSGQSSYGGHNTVRNPYSQVQRPQSSSLYSWNNQRLHGQQNVHSYGPTTIGTGQETDDSDLVQSQIPVGNALDDSDLTQKVESQNSQQFDSKPGNFQQDLGNPKPQNSFLHNWNNERQNRRYYNAHSYGSSNSNEQRPSGSRNFEQQQVGQEIDDSDLTQQTEDENFDDLIQSSSGPNNFGTSSSSSKPVSSFNRNPQSQNLNQQSTIDLTQHTEGENIRGFSGQQSGTLNGSPNLQVKPGLNELQSGGLLSYEPGLTQPSKPQGLPQSSQILISSKPGSVNNSDIGQQIDETDLTQQTEDEDFRGLSQQSGGLLSYEPGLNEPVNGQRNPQIQRNTPRPLGLQSGNMNKGDDSYLTQQTEDDSRRLTQHSDGLLSYEPGLSQPNQSPGQFSQMKPQRPQDLSAAHLRPVYNSPGRVNKNEQIIDLDLTQQVEENGLSELNQQSGSISERTTVPSIPQNRPGFNYQRPAGLSRTPGQLSKPLNAQSGSDDSEFTQQLENEDLTQKVENGDLTQKVENEDLTQKIESGDLTQKVENEDFIQKIESGDLTQKVENEDSQQQTVPLKPASSHIQNVEGANKLDNSDLTQQVEIVQGQELDDLNKGQQIDDSDVVDLNHVDNKLDFNGSTEKLPGQQITVIELGRPSSAVNLPSASPQQLESARRQSDALIEAIRRRAQERRNQQQDVQQPEQPPEVPEVQEPAFIRQGQDDLSHQRGYLYGYDQQTNPYLVGTNVVRRPTKRPIEQPLVQYNSGYGVYAEAPPPGGYHQNTYGGSGDREPFIPGQQGVKGGRRMNYASQVTAEEETTGKIEPLAKIEQANAIQTVEAAVPQVNVAEVDEPNTTPKPGWWSRVGGKFKSGVQSIRDKLKI